MVSEAYMYELDHRLGRALTHWEEMQEKYNDMPEDANAVIGYGKWVKPVKRGNGATLFDAYEAPLPHYYLYYPYFLELITKLPDYNIIPSIESTFHGDGVDLDYIEHLIERYIEAGVLEKGGPIITDDINATLRFYEEGCTVEQIIESGIDEKRIINPECDIAKRFEIVRGWINKMRYSPTYLPVIVTYDSAVAGNDSTESLPSLILKQEKRTKDTTVAELCRPPFTKADLSNLLQHLRLIDSSGICLTNSLEGKGAGLRSKFTAAYRVLHRAQLMESTANDAEWASAFRTEYHAEIGETAQKHELTAHGKAVATSSLPFQKGVDEVNAWVINWRENQS